MLVSIMNYFALVLEIDIRQANESLHFNLNF